MYCAWFHQNTDCFVIIVPGKERENGTQRATHEFILGEGKGGGMTPR